MVHTIKVLSVLLCLALPVMAQARPVDFQIVEKGFNTGLIIDHHTFRFRLVNRTEFDFRAAQITVTVSDLFDEDLIRLRVSFDDPIPAGTSYTTKKRAMRHNQFIPRLVRLRGLDLSDLQVSWQVHRIRLADGTIVESKLDLLDLAGRQAERRQEIAEHLQAERERIREQYGIITREDFDSIDVGDSREWVVDVFGSDGTKTRTASFGDRNIETYEWRNPPPFRCGVRIKFVDGEVSEKAQIGRLE